MVKRNVPANILQIQGEFNFLCRIINSAFSANTIDCKLPDFFVIFVVGCADLKEDLWLLVSPAVICTC